MAFFPNHDQFAIVGGPGPQFAPHLGLDLGRTGVGLLDPSENPATGGHGGTLQDRIMLLWAKVDVRRIIVGIEGGTHPIGVDT
jgi:hypothetical protein